MSIIEFFFRPHLTGHSGKKSIFSSSSNLDEVSYILEDSSVQCQDSDLGSR
jgi:hypothetical protein